jgi:hypothetical protein
VLLLLLLLTAHGSAADIALANDGGNRAEHGVQSS